MLKELIASMLHKLTDLFKKSSVELDASSPLSDGQQAIAKLLARTGNEDLRIDESGHVYVTPREKSSRKFWLARTSQGIAAVGAGVKFSFPPTATKRFRKRDVSWRELSPELCDKLATEALASAFFALLPPADPRSPKVVLVPAAETAAELALKLDMAQPEELVITYRELLEKSLRMK